MVEASASNNTDVITGVCHSRNSISNMSTKVTTTNLGGQFVEVFEMEIVENRRLVVDGWAEWHTPVNSVYSKKRVASGAYDPGWPVGPSSHEAQVHHVDAGRRRASS